VVGGSILGKLVEFLLSYDTILLNQLVALSRVHRLRGADTPGEQSLWVGLWCAMSPASISVQPCRICHTKYEVKVLMAGRGWAHVVRSNDAYNLAFYQPVRTFCNAIQKSTAHTEGVACECGAARADTDACREIIRQGGSVVLFGIPCRRHHGARCRSSARDTPVTPFIQCPCFLVLLMRES
jgi:hypothetical protein